MKLISLFCMTAFCLASLVGGLAHADALLEVDTSPTLYSQFNDAMIPESIARVYSPGFSIQGTVVDILQGAEIREGILVIEGSTGEKGLIRLLSGTPHIAINRNPLIENVVGTPVEVGDVVLVRTLFRRGRLGAHWCGSFDLIAPSPHREQVFADFRVASARHLEQMGNKIASKNFAGARAEIGPFMKSQPIAYELNQLAALVQTMPAAERPVSFLNARLYVNALEAGFDVDFDSMTKSQLIQFANDWAELSIRAHDPAHGESLDETYIYELLAAASVPADQIMAIKMKVVRSRLMIIEDLAQIHEKLEWADVFVINQTMLSLAQAQPSAALVRFSREIIKRRDAIPNSPAKGDVCDGPFGLNRYLEQAIANAQAAAYENSEVAAALHGLK